MYKDKEIQRYGDTELHRYRDYEILREREVPTSSSIKSINHKCLAGSAQQEQLQHHSMHSEHQDPGEQQEGIFLKQFLVLHSKMVRC